MHVGVTDARTHSSYMFIPFFFSSKLVEGAQLITINFHAIYPNATMETIMKKWEHAVLDYSLASLNDPLIHLYTTSEGLVSEEVRRTGRIFCFVRGNSTYEIIISYRSGNSPNFQA